MEGNCKDNELYTESVQPLFDQLEEMLTFLPNEEMRKMFLNVYAQLICM